MSFSKYQLSEARPAPLGLGPPIVAAQRKASLQSTQQHSSRNLGLDTLNLILVLPHLQATTAPGSAIGGAIGGAATVVVVVVVVAPVVVVTVVVDIVCVGGEPLVAATAAAEVSSSL